MKEKEKEKESKRENKVKSIGPTCGVYVI